MTTLCNQLLLGWVGAGMGTAVYLYHTMEFCLGNLLISLLVLSAPMRKETTEADWARFTPRCHDWVNYSTFLAQYTALGFFDDGLAYEYPGYDIPLGLGGEAAQDNGRHPNVGLRTTRLLVAAQ